MSFKEKILRLIDRVRYRFDKNQKPYKLKGISPLKKAKAMDIVLELCLNYYIGKQKKIDFYEVATVLDKKLNLCVTEAEFLLDIMSDLGYIVEVYKKPPEKQVIEKIYSTPKGIKAFIDGGFELEANRKMKERRLISITQYSSAIVGVYYLAIFLKEYLGVSPELLKNLICSAYKLLIP
ncbi:hypothetical protein [Mariniflexile sp. AS56]|uniref:hypothetical protein n=1 Tax=Flavobacteriaceae TaxID=49546 RepID=UPI0026EDA206|nr:hypothetical protein [Mariniflexile sp. AS56]MDO7174188.1 hypothetical protein [Mariniflexile sp. AS56]